MPYPILCLFCGSPLSCGRTCPDCGTSHPKDAHRARAEATRSVEKRQTWEAEADVDAFRKAAPNQEEDRCGD